MAELDQLQIHRSRWVVPVSSDPVENGAVVCLNQKILDVGKWSQIPASFPGAQVTDHGESILFPGLINCHIHIDNSALLNKTRRDPRDMTEWIDSHFSASKKISADEKAEAISSTWQTLPKLGTIAVGDISYDPLSNELARKASLFSQLFCEVVGFGRERAELSLSAAKILQESSVLTSTALAPHGPHSLNVEILCRIFEENRRSNRRTSIHLAESPEEIEFLLNGNGPFKDALLRWGFLDDSFKVPGCSPVEYLNRLGLLGPDLIAVHCVHLQERDFVLLREYGVNVCLCPRSNNFIGNGQPEIRKLIDNEIPICLGTDGLASNDSISLFDEMEFIRIKHPEIAPEELLDMVTINGARALGMDKQLGSLEKNKHSRFLIYKEYNGNKPVEEITGKIQMEKLAWAGGAFERNEDWCN